MHVSFFLIQSMCLNFNLTLTHLGRGFCESFAVPTAFALGK